MTAFEDFDPNNPSYASNVFGVWAQGTFKVYARRASALSRFAALGRAKIYEFDVVVGRWIERGVKDRSNARAHCTACGGTTMAPPMKYKLASDGWGYVPDFSLPATDQGEYAWQRRSGKIAEPLTLHYACNICLPGVRRG